MKHRDLNAPPSQTMAEIVRGLKRQAESSKTGAHGVKHMGASGDSVWTRPDGSAHSVREIDADLDAAQGRIDSAESDLADARQQVEDAKAEAEAAQGRLDTLDDTTLPEIRDDLQAQADAAQQEFEDLDERLNSFGDDPALSGLRQELADAQDAAASANDAASAANDAAGAASQAALEAAGIAESKGRVIVSETEPTGEDRTSSNIWIQPVEDDPETDVEEKAVTYVYLEASDEWQATTSSELAQAAQNALDAREAAQQAQQRAETAISNAATAQSAAEAAQRTADEATTDARDAWNEAVAAGEAAGDAYDEAASKLGESEVEAIVTASANGKNSITRKATEPNVDGVVEGDAWYQVDANGDSFAKWMWDGDEWVPSLIKNEMMESLDLHKLNITGSGTAEEFTVNKLWADYFAAKTLIAQSLSIAPGNMLIDGLGKTQAGQDAYANGDFEWDADEGAWVDTVRAPGNTQMFLNPPGTENYTAYTIEPGREYRLAYDMKIVGGAGRTRGAIRETLADGTTRFVGDRTEPGGDTSAYTDLPADTWVKVDRTYVAPADIALASFEAQIVQVEEGATVYMARNLYVGPKTGAVNIEYGAVSTPHLNVTESMSAALVDAMSVNAKELIVTEEAILNHATLIGDTVVDDINVTGKLIGEDGVFTGTVDFANVNVTGEAIVDTIGANEIDASQINGDTFQGNTFNGGTFNGAIFRTGGTTTESRPGAYMGSYSGYTLHGVGAYGENGSDAYLLAPNHPDLAPYLRFYDPSGTTSAEVTGAADGKHHGLRINHANGTRAIEAYKEGIDNARAWISLNRWDGTQSIQLGSADESNHAYLSVHDGAGNHIHHFWGDSEMRLAGERIVFYGPTGSGDDRDKLRIGNPENYLRFYSAHSTRPGEVTAGGDWHFFDHATTSSGANTYLNSSSGLIARSTSSRRYKRNIVNWSPDAERVLQLRPRQWQHDDPESPIDETWHVGFVAEEVADIGGLDGLIEYAGDGKGGWRPDALHYDRFAAAHQVVLKDHEARIAELETENADLRATVDALTARLDAAGI